MDNRLHISQAMAIAANPGSLQEQCRAISVLESHFSALNAKQATMVDGYSYDEIKTGLLDLVSSQRYSEAFVTHIEQARQKILNYLRMSPQFLSDVKNWTVMNDSERQTMCNKMVREIAHVFRDLGHLPPTVIPSVGIINNDQHSVYLDASSEPVSYIPTVTTQPADDNYGDCILINKNPATKYNDPLMTLTQVYGSYICLVEEKLGDSRTGYFSENLTLFGDDVNLWVTTRNEGAFIDPYLDEIQAAQFNKALVYEQQTLFYDALEKVMAAEWNSIPVRQPIPQTFGQKFSGFMESALRLGQ